MRMNVMDNNLFEKNQQEGFKALIHLALFGLSTAAQLYNASAWLMRRDSHLAVNVAVYTSLASFEAYQVYKHLNAGETNGSR
jgi:hypothetical protein